MTMFMVLHTNWFNAIFQIFLFMQWS